MDIFKDSKMGLNRLEATKPSSRQGNHQELTLSYLMDTSSSKGKEIVAEENQPNGRGEKKWVERDFLNLGRGSELPPKREAVEEDEGGERREKKPKLESTLNLSLALPSASLSLTASSIHRNAMPTVAPSATNNTHTTCSNDFSAPSMSYTYSHPFSHNPSCSLTHNSTEHYEFSVGKDDPIWYGGGEGTNGSVHSRFKPIGDASVALTDPGNFSMQGGSFYKTTGSANCSENISYFPSELPARPRKDAPVSGDSAGRHSNLVREHEGIVRRSSLPERLIREIVTESIPVMAQIVAELPDEVVESAKDCLRALIASSERREELHGLRNCLDERADLTKETLVKCHREQLNIMVSVRTGLQSFLSDKIQVPASESIEIFLYMRCRNLNCKSHLPVDDCECEICFVNKGFCSSCMCPVCLNFDCASNTCSWVGCDVCSHWCHASCGLHQNLIRPGPSLKGPAGTTEMQFHCLGCNHASEMFGFVKDVFTCCAKDWGLETLMKELDCVKKIFQMSEDFKGKELHGKAEDLLLKLDRKLVLPSDACNMIIKFFNYIESELASPSLSSKSIRYAPSGFGNDKFERPPAIADFQKDLKSSFLFSEDKLVISASSKGGSGLGEDVFDSIESIIRIKEAEARMFQNIADGARREAEMYKEMVRVKMDKLEEEYAQRLAKLCLQETEERRMKMLEELKALENSHCDYQNMKMRMQAEIAGLWERIQATKQQLV